MATIQTMISLIDNMSPALYDIMTAADSTSQVIDNLQAQAAETTGANGIDSLGEAAFSASDAVSDLQGKITALATAIGAITAVKKVLDLSDTMASNMARIHQMNDGLQTTQDLVESIHQASNRSRGSFQSMTDIVARFGNNARSAFSSSQEVVDFAEIIQKQMTIAGTGTQEAANAMLQLSQALGSGVLRGDELNSIFEQAPNLIQTIADYMDVPIGQIRKLASDGEITADIVKNAMFASADEINAKFEEMPMTWSQLRQTVSNDMQTMMQPVLNIINALAGGFYSVYQVVSDNWSTIGPIVEGVATAVGILALAIGGYMAVTTIAAAAQAAFNAVLATCPAVWIMAAIAGVIGVFVALASHVANTSDTVSTTFGVITGWISVAIAFAKNLLATVGNVTSGIIEATIAVAHNLGVAFQSPIAAAKGLFYSLLSTAMEVISGIAEALNRLPFVEFDISGLKGAAADYAQKAADATADLDYQDVGAAFDFGASAWDAFGDGWLEDAWKAGTAWGDNIASGGSQYVDPTIEGIAYDASDIASSSASTAKALQTSEEDLKYLRDIAEQEVINRFTTAEISVTMGGVTNNVSNDTDLDGIINYLATGVQNAMSVAAEGVHI